MCMRCWDDTPYCPRCSGREVVYYPVESKPYKAPPKKKPNRKAKSHVCAWCGHRIASTKMKWDTFSEIWMCRNERACRKRVYDDLVGKMSPKVREQWEALIDTARAVKKAGGDLK